MMYAFLRFSGHYQIEGVGYATIQDVLLGAVGAAPFLALLFVVETAGDFAQPGLGFVRRNLFALAVHGRDAGRRHSARWRRCCSRSLNVSVPAFAMVGMAAMVGGGTGAAMTAVTMIFEMTLDYGIVVPMIIAVAISIGIRRILSRENIYTIKLQARRHFIPKALHANMFLVRRAGEVMDKDMLVLPQGHAVRRFSQVAGAWRQAAPCRGHPGTTGSWACCASTPRCGAGWRAPSPASRWAMWPARNSRSRAPRTSCSTSSGGCGARMR